MEDNKRDNTHDDSTFAEMVSASFTDHEASVMWARAVAGASRDMSATDIEFQDL